MSKIDRLEKEMKKVDEEVSNYIHEVSDIKIPTDKEFYKHKKKVNAKVISSEVFLGFTNSEDIVYDVVFEYTINNILYKSKMQSKNKYNVSDIVELYYYTKNPEFTREIIDDEKEPYILEIVLFIILFMISSFLVLKFL